MMPVTPSARTPIALDPEILLPAYKPLALAPGTVHTWLFALTGTDACIELCRSLLSPQERARADRFVFERDRTRYTIAHAVMRSLLSRYCDATPDSVGFRTSAKGKPSLEVPGSATVPLHFNLSHSEDRALLGVSSVGEIGVDLEKTRSNIEALEISRHYFFGAERAEIEATGPAERHDMFFRYWVAKEAVLKAQGIGLGFPLDRFRVAFLADRVTARVDSFDSSVLGNDWRVRMLPCQSGWHAAVAARGEAWELTIESGV